MGVIAIGFGVRSTGTYRIKEPVKTGGSEVFLWKTGKQLISGDGGGCCCHFTQKSVGRLRALSLRMTWRLEESWGERVIGPDLESHFLHTVCCFGDELACLLFD